MIGVEVKESARAGPASPPISPSAADGAPRAAPRIEADAEPIPGYRLLARLGQGGFGEVWKVEAPGGILKAAKFVSGICGGGTITAPALQEFQALRRVKDIRHPFLISIDRIEVVGETLVIVMELADQSLHDLLVQSRQEGEFGIPRANLLVYLCEAAEALDVMNQQHHLQHLDIKPNNLFLVGNHVKVGDFGLARDMSGLAGGRAKRGPLGGVTPLYAAPECFQGMISPTCDQYSLAITYQQLLTGTLPFDAADPRRLALRHAMSEPDLSALPASDRPIIAKALSKRPEKRFSTCLELIEALATGQLPTLASTAHSSGQRKRSRVIVQRIRESEPACSAEPAGDSRVAGETNLEICLPAHPSSPAVSAARSEIPGVGFTGLTSISGGLSGSADMLLPGYQFLSCVTSEPPLREIWKARAPGGRTCIVQMISGFDFPDEGKFQQALLRLQGLQHAGLVPLRIAHVLPDRIFLDCEPTTDTVRDAFQKWQREGRTGVPRDELLAYLREAAEILDELRAACDLQHLGLHPRLLQVSEGGLQIAEFGIAHLLWATARQLPPRLAARYAAPELLHCEISQACDQFSLAAIYQEMLTGLHPFRGQTTRQAGSRGAERANLDLLPSQDRPVVARALQRDPRKRFASCGEFVEALTSAGPRAATPLTGTSGLAVATRSLILPAVPFGSAKPPAIVQPSSPDCVKNLLRSLTEPFELEHFGPIRFLHRRGTAMRHRCSAYLPSSLAAPKLEAFRERWNADIVSGNGNAVVYHIDLPRSFWQRISGKRPGLRIPIQVHPPSRPGASLTEIQIEIAPVDCDRRQAEESLFQWGPRLVESFREFVQAKVEERSQERLEFTRPIQVFPLLPGQQLGEPFACQGKDLSIGGVGFFLPTRPQFEYACISLSSDPGTPPLTLLARLVRVQPSTNGWWEIGALFLPH